GSFRSAWVKPSSTFGTISQYGALPERTSRSDDVSFLAHSIVVGMRPLALGCGRWPGWNWNPSSCPLFKRPGIWLLIPVSHSALLVGSPPGVQPLAACSIGTQVYW